LLLIPNQNDGGAIVSVPFVTSRAISKKAQKIIKKQTKRSGHFLAGSETLIFYSENSCCLIVS
jgi:hypothetical protein